MFPTTCPIRFRVTPLAEVLLIVFVFFAAPANLQAGHFANITIDDSYGDWAGVPVVDSDAGDNFSGPDIGDTQIANDANYLYIRNTFPNSLQLSTYIGIDVDQNPATGFDVFSLGLLGSEAGWQNDFGFSQATGVFNSGPLIGADFFGAGHALLAPFGNFGQRELAISLANANNGGLPTFPGNTIRLLIYTDTGAGADGLPAGFPGDSGINGDISAVINYTLTVPEPTALTLMTIAGFGVLILRRPLPHI
jgi:hypothetical protein